MTSAECGAFECFDERCDGRRITYIANSNRAACVARSAGTVWCWGNANGSLFPADPGPHPEPWRVPVLHAVDEVEGGERFFCARQGAEVWCWGNNDFGRLGDPDAGAESLVPLRVQGLGPAKDISVGFKHVCALLLDGSVWCWGSNDNQQLGPQLPLGSSSATPVRAVKPDSGVTVVSAGTTHTCVSPARWLDAGVGCWGSNMWFELGVDQTVVPTTTAIPVAVAGLTGTHEVKAGRGHSCSVRDERVFCWGDGVWSGGPRDGGDAGTPEDGGGDAGVVVEVLNTGAGPPMRGLGGFAAHVCGIAGGKLLCWGGNHGGNLLPTRKPGACPSVTYCLPLEMALEGVVQVTAGAFTLALLADGGVMAWGLNAQGVLGHDLGTNGDVPCEDFELDAGSASGLVCNSTPQLHRYLP